ncbi:alpha/beta hydrolase [Kineococcus rhizosphaerae]|uniref:Acetyl esterase/lipase n=1 Tax=Kineococcus rhizosphaerae TaxID=559628 RepID=A0A2T0R0I6_9ACTN|nr:alpha/beta hydrolase [Kineococcus rhizosphaerae]PRY12620.1 acetyl esterase/lipase [Kineococcus rhizosphaerae]
MSVQQRQAVDTALRTPRPRPATIEEIRADFVALMATMRVPGGVRTGETTLGGRRALLVERERDPRPGTVLYFHGGSHVFGSPETALSLTANLVARTGFRAYSLDYRLAPEHPFPADVEDGVAAYRDLLGYGPVALAGDSAGGALTVSTTLSLRAAGLPLPAGIVSLSGAFDYTRSGESFTTRAALDPVLSPGEIGYLGGLYVGDADPADPRLAAAVTGDLTGFPPVLLQVGTNEILLDDSVRLARRAWDAGADVVLDVTAGVPHVFQSYAGVLDEADEALDRAALFLTQRLG